MFISLWYGLFYKGFDINGLLEVRWLIFKGLTLCVFYHLFGDILIHFFSFIRLVENNKLDCNDGKSWWVPPVGHYNAILWYHPHSDSSAHHYSHVYTSRDLHHMQVSLHSASLESGDPHQDVADDVSNHYLQHPLHLANYRNMIFQLWIWLSCSYLIWNSSAIKVTNKETVLRKKTTNCNTWR